MVKVYTENIKSDFEGTIIDIETTGEFEKRYKGDSREYGNLTPVIFGFINKEQIQILYGKTQDTIPELKIKIEKLLPSLEKPFYAFNTDFERGVLFHSINKKVEFERELNLHKFEAKRNAVRLLKIPNYDDPFNDVGKLCMQAWLRGEIDKAIAHNRSCLLKEREIYLKRGFREPDGLNLIPWI